jgi:hypothetical protein
VSNFIDRGSSVWSFCEQTAKKHGDARVHLKLSRHLRALGTP